VNSLQLYSEPFAKTGNIAAEGSKRLLGRPTLGLLQTVLREGIQNVIDAAISPSGPTLLIRFRTLTQEQQVHLQKNVFLSRPDHDSTRLEIDAALAKPGLRVLELCDFGTRGLSGPTSADAPHDGEEPLNFVNFLRNVGARRDTRQGGGTYGYGKSSLYAMSSCSTIVVDSQTQCSGTAVRRFMACHLGAAFDSVPNSGARRRYTGRHWWGLLDGINSVDPATDAFAAALALSIGLPPRTESDSGTSIMIIDPLFGGEGAEAAVDDIVETVLWNFWPRMTSSTPTSRRLKVILERDGHDIHVPAPEDFPPLDLFAAAIAEHRTNNPELQTIRCGKPKADLGRLAIKRGLRADRRGPAARDGSLIPKQASHIALMRPVELVVRYLEGDPLPDRRFDWAGVFICSEADEIEEAFALAEPPAHDDWVPDNLPKGSAKTYVNVALRRLGEIARPHVPTPPEPAISADRGPSLAATAAKMGSLLGAVSASGPGRPTRGTGKPSTRKMPAVSSPQFVGLELDDSGKAIARFRAEILNNGEDHELWLIAEPHLVVDGGLTTDDDLPNGYDLRVNKIELMESRESSDNSWIHVGERGGAVEVLVPTNPEAAVGVKLRLRSGRPG
jgi:hypothetical protein